MNRFQKLSHVIWHCQNNIVGVLKCHKGIEGLFRDKNLYTPLATSFNDKLMEYISASESSFLFIGLAWYYCSLIKRAKELITYTSIVFCR